MKIGQTDGFEHERVFVQPIDQLKNQRNPLKMKVLNWKLQGVRVLFLLLLTLSATASWAMDAEEAESAAQDTRSETEDAAVGSDSHFDPPHDEHVNPTPEVATHQSGASAAGGASLAEAATDPSAVLTQFQNLFWTTGTSEDNNIANTYLLQPVLPLSRNNVLRPALPVINSSGKTGIGDLFLLDAFLNPVKTGTFGWGIAGSVPIGDDEFSSNKWTAGPTLLYINKTSHKVLWGVLGYNQWSFAGKSSARDVNTLSFQPIYVVHTSWGYWGWTDQLSTIDWKNDNQMSIPLGLRFGKVYPGKTPLNVSVGFYYALNNKGMENTFGLKVTAAFIKPTWLTH
jgi:hypothetical protein